MANNDNLIPYKKGQSGNPNGRPRKSFASINLELEAKGVKRLSKADLLDAYALIFNSTEDDLKELAKDANTPYALKIIILELNNSKSRNKAMQDFRDYTFGKAQENKDITTNGDSLIPNQIVFFDTDED
tara:strand:+ start:150 stop:536 length:387 start_codon:yes stop_codon:yes gene_type:complete